MQRAGRLAVDFARRPRELRYKYGAIPLAIFSVTDAFMPHLPGPEPGPSIDERRIAPLRGSEAVAVGKRLMRKHPDFAAGYELAARGYEDLGRPRAALRLLERAVARHGDNWRLLESLAIRCSDAGRYDQALATLDRALALAADAASLHYNRALVFVRMDRAGAALAEAWLALRHDPDLTNASLLAAALECAVGQLDVARERLEQTLEKLLAADPDARDGAALSDACRALAEIELAHHRRDEALELFRRALAFERRNAAALYWVRELTGARSPDACYYRLVVCGRWPAGRTPPVQRPVVCRGPACPPEPPVAIARPGAGDPFTTLYDVVAEAPEEAMTFVRALEPPDVADALVLDSAKVMKRFVQDPKGIYRVWPYRF